MKFIKRAGNSNILVFNEDNELIASSSAESFCKWEQDQKVPYLFKTKNFNISSADSDKLTSKGYKLIKTFSYDMYMKFRNKDFEEWTRLSFEDNCSDLIELKATFKLKRLLKRW